MAILPSDQVLDQTSALDLKVPGAQGHFQLYVYAAVFYLTHYLYHLRSGDQDGLARTLESFPFLGRYLARMQSHLPNKSTWDVALGWWHDKLMASEQDSPEELPLCRALKQRDERIAMVLVGLVEEDARFGNLFAALADSRGARRPTFSLVSAVLEAAESAVGSDGVKGRACQYLLDRGLVYVLDAGLPRSQWELAVHPFLWSALRGENPPQGTGVYRWVARHQLPDDNFFGVSPEMSERLRYSARGLLEGRADALVVRGTPSSERFDMMAVVARQMGLNLLQIEQEALAKSSVSESLGALATVSASLPVFQFEGIPGQTRRLPTWVGYDGPVGVVTDHYGGIVFDEPYSVEKGNLAMSKTVITLEVPRPTADERQMLWTKALGAYDTESDPQDVQEISRRWRLPTGTIRRAAAAAVAQAEMEGRRRVTPADIRLGLRHLGREGLESLASSLEAKGTWADLVVTEEVSQRLRELQGRCRYRERLNDHLGQAFAGKPSVGVRALFSGPSGTGKTLTAQIVAAELGMDLYRIDLAAVVNKYVGETEKNLHRALTAAEEADIVLLLDEGDSLLARRSEVRGANDRYANLETNFLLQRLDNYQGIVFITTNAAQNIDPAFQRRMDMVVHFSLPRATERRALWQLHLPQHHRISDALLDALALHCMLSGGQIRSAVQNAALLALDDHDSIEDQHVLNAVRGEYRKAGALFPLENIRSPGGQTDRDGTSQPAAAFIRALRTERSRHERKNK